MKKTLLICLLFVLVVSLVVAQQGIHEPGTGNENPEIKEAGQGTGQGQEPGENPMGEGTGDGQQTGTGQDTQNQGEGQNLMVQEKAQVKAQTGEGLKQMLQEKKQEMTKEQEGMSKKEQKVYMNQNSVREAVHTMLAAEDLVGGIGKDVSAIAKEFDNSVKKTIDAETRIEKRGWFSRLMIGGDKEAANQLESETAQNKARIQQLNKLMENCECDEEVKAMLQEQIQNMEQEQIRLQQLAESEGKKNGFFGWMFRKK